MQVNTVQIHITVQIRDLYHPSNHNELIYHFKKYHKSHQLGRKRVFSRFLFHFDSQIQFLL